MEKITYTFDVAAGNRDKGGNIRQWKKLDGKTLTQAIAEIKQAMSKGYDVIDCRITKDKN